jgi:FkbM family methyltransferase
MSETALQAHLRRLAAGPGLPDRHLRYLQWLKAGGFEPRVVYDIGASVLHWTSRAREVWPDAEFILFDAFEPAEFLYEGHRRFMGVLSDVDGREVNFYQNNRSPAGNSYYREVGYKHADVFPVGSHTVRVARSLDAVVAECGFPLPDLVKIDVQGAERDVISGGGRVLAGAKRMIVEIQHEVYNDGAPLVGETKPWIEAQGWRCDAAAFSRNVADADYGFVRLASV